jgi:hypothetical protein
MLQAIATGLTAAAWAIALDIALLMLGLAAVCIFGCHAPTPQKRASR